MAKGRRPAMTPWNAFAVDELLRSLAALRRSVDVSDTDAVAVRLLCTCTVASRVSRTSRGGGTSAVTGCGFSVESIRHRLRTVPGVPRTSELVR